MINNLLVADTVQRIKNFAVAIRKFPNHTHAGVLYVHPAPTKPEDAGLFLLHLGRPGKLIQERWNEEWGWVSVPLKREIQFQLSVLCQAALEAKEDIPYGFKYIDATRFLRDGRLATAEGYKGITCATFVLAILASFDIMLLDLATWPVRAEDEESIRCIASAQNDPAVAAEFPCVRYRPEEVVAACLANSLNVPFSTAEPVGKQVLSKMVGYLDRKRGGV